MIVKLSRLEPNGTDHIRSLEKVTTRVLARNGKLNVNADTEGRDRYGTVQVYKYVHEQRFPAEHPFAEPWCEEKQHSQTTSLGKLALDEGQSLLSILAAIALVGGGIGAVAAVRVGGIAVALDVGRAGARETTGTSGELKVARLALIDHHRSSSYGYCWVVTYSTGGASSHVVAEASDVCRRAHPNRSLDCGDRSRGQSRAASTAQSLVHDLASLGITNQDYLRARALRNVGYSAPCQ